MAQETELGLGGFTEMLGEDVWGSLMGNITETPIEKKDEKPEETPIEKSIEAPIVETIDEETLVEEINRKAAEKKKKESKSKEEITTTPEVAGEAEFIKTFATAYFEKNGWETEGIEMPDTVEGFMEYVDTVIEANSAPTFASAEVERLNRFVENGGDIRDYLDSGILGLDYDMESPVDQKRAVTDLLKRQGLNSDQIKRKINKYEEAGILEDEAREAIELLGDISEKEKNALLEASENQKKQAEEQQKEFQSQVIKTIRQMDDIHGIKLSEADKKKLLKYGFEPDSTGLTAFAKKFQSDVKYLINTIYLTMFEDKLIDSAKKVGEKTAVEKLKEMLKNNVEHKSTSKAHYGEGKRFWEEL